MSGAIAALLIALLYVVIVAALAPKYLRQLYDDHALWTASYLYAVQDGAWDEAEHIHQQLKALQRQIATLRAVLRPLERLGMVKL